MSAAAQPVVARLFRGIAVAWLLALTALVAFPARATAGNPARPTQRLVQADLLDWPGNSLPGADAHAQPVRLPYKWRTPSASEAATIWLRIPFTWARSPGEPLFAIYAPGLNRSARLYLNGHLIGTAGSFEEPMPLNWNRPQFFTASPDLLRDGANELLVHERSYGYQFGWLSALTIGDAPALRPVYMQRRFWQNDLVMLLCATTLVLSLFVLGLGLLRRDQTMYLWFGAATLVWSVISLDYFIVPSPLPGVMWEQFLEIAQVLHALLIYVFVLRYTGRRRPRLEAVLWGYWGAGSAGVALALLHGHGVELWYLGALVASLYFWVLLVRAAWERRRSGALLLAAAALTTIVLSAYDLWLFTRHTWTDHVYLAHFGAPLMLFAIGWNLMREFVDTLGAHERLNATLEQRVQAKAAELERNYQALADARRQEALAVERARIMSEMHDGIGSQLTTALALVQQARGEADPVAAVLRESIDDLQLIIDSLEPVEDDLLIVLATLRYRVQDRLQRSGIGIQWNVSDLPPMRGLSPHGVLAILRILQEAFANCVKHSQASEVQVVTELQVADDGRPLACIRIVDNGRGITGTRQGRGLKSMRRRAEHIGARVAIESRPGRTEVALCVPLRG